MATVASYLLIAQYYWVKNPFLKKKEIMKNG